MVQKKTKETTLLRVSANMCCYYALAHDIYWFFEFLIF